MRIALAGYAYGRLLHQPLIEQAGGEIVAVSTSDPGRIELAHEQLPHARVVPDLTALLAAVPEVGADVVVLATPTGAHAEHVRQVIAAGVPCVCDKPLTVDAESSAAVVAEAREARVPLTVFHNRRWDEAPLALRAAIDAGALGELRRFEMRYDRWRPEPKQRWRENARWEEGGGVLLDLGPHCIDTAVQFMGPITSVYAEVNNVSTPADDDVVLYCRHAGGGSSILTASSVSPTPGPRFRVNGTTAGYLYDHGDESPIFTVLENAEGAAGWIYQAEERRPAPRGDGDEAGFYRGLAHALQQSGYEAVQATMPVQPEDAVHTAKVIDAARLSAAENRVVTID